MCKKRSFNKFVTSGKNVRNPEKTSERIISKQSHLSFSGRVKWEIDVSLLPIVISTYLEKTLGHSYCATINDLLHHRSKTFETFPNSSTNSSSNSDLPTSDTARFLVTEDSGDNSWLHFSYVSFLLVLELKTVCEILFSHALCETLRLLSTLKYQWKCAI